MTISRDRAEDTFDAAWDDDVHLATRLHCPILITAAERHDREKIARSIHQQGHFVSARCTDINESFFAQHRTTGTLFLDDVSELSPEMQERLLAFLSAGAPRVIAATAKALADEIATNRFRADLFYRLNVIHITRL